MSEGGEEIRAEEVNPATPVISDEFEGAAIVDGHRARVVHVGKLAEILDTTGTYLYLEDDKGKLIKIHRPDPKIKQYEAVDAGEGGAKVLLKTGDLRSGEIVRGKSFRYGEEKHTTGAIKRIYVVEPDKEFPGQIKRGPAVDVAKQFQSPTGVAA